MATATRSEHTAKERYLLSSKPSITPACSRLPVAHKQRPVEDNHPLRALFIEV